jgi:tetratricopeptide (TPR) repeat protein
MIDVPYQSAQGSFIAQATTGAVAIAAEKLVVEVGADLHETLRKELLTYLKTAVQSLTRPVLVRTDGTIVGEGSQIIVVKSEHLRELLAQFTNRKHNTPLQLPLDVPTFTGREAELRMLKSNLVNVGNRNRVVAICGMGGVGKSALVTRFAHSHQKLFPDGILWADLRAQATASVLDNFGRAYDEDLSSTRDLVAKSLTVRSILHEKRVLVVLDNAEYSHDLELLVPTGAFNVTLVTSRHSDMPALRGAEHIHLDVFDEAEALQHFSSVVGDDVVRKSLAEARAISLLCGYLPLALDVAVRLVRRARIDLRTFRELITDEHRRLIMLAEHDRSLIACFNLTWDALNNTQRRLFADLSVFGGSSFDTTAMAYVSRRDASELPLAMGDLVASSLAGITEGGRYYVHPLLKEFASSKLASLDRNHADAQHKRAIDYYLALVHEALVDHEMRGGNYENIRLELDNVLAAWHWADANSLTSELVQFGTSLSPVLFRHGDWTTCQRVLASSIESSRLLDDLDTHHQLRLQQGELARERADYAEAASHLEPCVEYFSQHEDKALLARSLRELAELKRVQRDYPGAMQLHKHCLALRRERGDLAGEAQSLHDCGLIEHILGNHGEAQRYVERALEISQQLGDRWQRAYSTLELGIIARLTNRYDEAKTLLSECLEMFNLLRDKRGQAYALRELGELAVSRNHYVEAGEHHRRSLELRIELGDKRGEAISYHRLGYVHQCLEDHASAGELYERSLAMAALLEDRLHLALNHVRLGELSEMRGDLAEARGHWQKGLACFEELKVGDPEAALAREHLKRTAAQRADTTFE